MAQISTKFVADNAINDLKERLRNNQPLRARNAADNADVNLLKLDASNVPQLLTKTQHNFTPTVGTDLANKDYVDTAVSAAAQVAKAAAQLVAVSNLSLTGEQTIDGVLTSASRILLTGQTAPEENGLYVTGAGAWTRATDADSSGEIFGGLSVWIVEGTNYASTLWFLNAEGPFVLDTDPLPFVKETHINKKENLTLNGTDITNQYKDLAFSALASSINLSVNGVMQYEGSDYTLSIVGGVTRVTFAGDLATGGGAALVSGDILHLQYER